MEMIFLLLLISILFNLILFIPAYRLKTDKLTDLSYALTFILLSLLSLFLTNLGKLNILITIMIFAWASRLGIFLFIRITKIKKDTRFDKIRPDFVRFLKFWILQGISVWLILIPSIIFYQSAKNVNFLSYLGLFIWFFGLLIETISDIQKYRFNINKNGRWISTGLWKYSRHPNYFGEILCWVGLYLFVFSSLSTKERIFSLIGPIYISILLIFITGISLLERKAEEKWGKYKEYQKYKKSTSVLIPWFNTN